MIRLSITGALLAAALAVSPARAPAAEGGDELAFTRFEGGSFAISVSAAGLALLGPGTGGLYATVAPVFPGPGRHLQNPALLGMSERPRLVFDMTPSFGVDLAKLAGLDDSVRDATDDFLSDALAQGSQVSYSNTTANFLGEGDLTGAAFELPAGRVNFAFSMDEALDVDFGLLASGIRTWGEIEKEIGDDTEIVRLRVDADISTRLLLAARRYSFAVGTQVLPSLWLGAGVDVHKYRAQMLGLVDVEGIISIGGREFVFDDPNDPWDNSLDQSLRGLYEGGGAVFRVGGGWRPFGALSLGFGITQGRSVEMPGEATLVSKRLVAYDGDGGLDPQNLSLSRPTETEVVESPVDDRLSLEFPGSAAFGLALGMGPLTLALDYQTFWGEFSVGYLDSYLNLHPEHMGKLGLYTGILSISVGAMLSSPIYDLDGEVQESGLVPLPLLAVGLGANITERLRIDLALDAAPLPALKVSTGILF